MVILIVTDEVIIPVWKLLLKKEYVRYLLRYNRRSQTAFSNAVSQYLLRYPFQTIAGDQTAHDSMMPAFNAVAEPMFAMAVGTDDLFCLILPSHRGELAVLSITLVSG